MSSSTPSTPISSVPTPPEKPAQKTQPVRNVLAVLAVLGVVVTSLQGIDWASHPSWQSIVGTLVSALMTAFGAYMIKYLPTQVVPFIDALIYRDASGNSVARPAAPLPNGTPAKAAPVDPTS